MAAFTYHVSRPLRASSPGGLCRLRQPPLRRFGPRPLRQGRGAREESSSLSRRGRRRRRRRPLLEKIRSNRGRGGETRIPFVAVVFKPFQKLILALPLAEIWPLRAVLVKRVCLQLRAKGRTATLIPRQTIHPDPFTPFSFLPLSRFCPGN